MIEETGENSWNGIRVRKNGKYGTIISDSNGYLRILNIKMDDGTRDVIVMNNIKDDPKETKQWEWFWDKTEDKKWYNF
jgi:hypothetical protein